MAQLPPDGTYLIQMISNEKVILFHRYREEQHLVEFDPSDANSAAMAQGHIAALECLDEEQKSMAHFWSGYFYGCAR